MFKLNFTRINPGNKQQIIDQLTHILGFTVSILQPITIIFNTAVKEGFSYFSVGSS
ncbi:hypothetical protein DOT_6113 [Desulfosporosinus sp. OT]|nr:hypothetical protein DOT_6113 [Desulfosporosinus sp. OT]